jgi:hypothetical protein
MKSAALITYPKTELQVKALKAFLQALGIGFDALSSQEPAYNPEFVAKVERSKKQIAEGKFVKVKVEALDELLGL